MIKYNNLHPIIWTENLQETLAFYTSILGFVCIDKNEDWQWMSLQKDNIIIMFSTPNQHEVFSKIGFTGSFYFNVNKVDEVWDEVNTKAKVCYPIETFEWGMREFAIYDNNGYILQFGEAL